jgi:antitoxin MazE
MPKLSRWGNSLGVRIPAHVAQRAAMQEGDEIYVRLLDSGEVLMRVAKARDVPVVLRPLTGDGVPAASKPLTDAEVKAQW